jgi:hypothetical protein
MQARIIRFPIERCRARSSVGMAALIYAHVLRHGADQHVYGVRYLRLGHQHGSRARTMNRQAHRDLTSETRLCCGTHVISHLVCFAA